MQAGPAQTALRDLVKELERQGHADRGRDPLAWIHFLYDIEKYYALSVLASYELNDIILDRSSLMSDIAVIRLERGMQPFTERRPSVTVEDSVFVQVPGLRRLVEVKVFHVSALEVWVQVREDNEAIPKELHEAIATRAKVHVQFDSKPFIGRCSLLQQATAFVEEFDRLSEPDGAEKRVNVNALVQSEGGDEETAYDQSRYMDDEELSSDDNEAPATRGRGRGRGRGARVERGGMMATAPPSRNATLQGNELLVLEDLDATQMAAVKFITGVKRPPGVTRAFLDGPAGTGKTEAIIRCVLHTLLTTTSRVVFTAPSNTAADVFADRLLRKLRSSPRLQRYAPTVLRYFKSSRHPLRCPPSIIANTNLNPMKEFHELNFLDRFDQDLSRDGEYMSQFRVIIITQSAAKRILTKDVDLSSVSHVFLDEAAQAHLTEGLWAMRLANSRTFITFAGDINQMRPYALTPYVRQWMQKSPVHHAIDSHIPRFILRRSHRATEPMGELLSFLFYDGKLVPHGPKATDGEDSVWNDWSGHYGRNPSPLRFIHCGGIEEAANNSFINRGEADCIVNLALNMKTELRVNPRHITVFSQFQEQRKHLMNRLALHGLRAVRVAEIDEFQGNESEVVILSLVHTEPHTDGFLGRNELCTALTRSKSRAIIVGSGTMVQGSENRTWKKLLEQLLEKEAVDGYDYDEEAFDANLYQRLDTTKAKLEIKEFVPQFLRSQRLDSTPTSADAVTGNVQDYFIGTAVVPTSWDEGVFVRNRFRCSVDVGIDEDTVAGRRRLILFPGDVVAMRVDPDLRDRWRPANGTVGILPPDPSDVLLSPTAPAIDPPSCPSRDIDAMLGCKDLRECAELPLIPCGVPVCVLQRAALPPLQCDTAISKSGQMILVPRDERYPPLDFTDNHHALPATPRARLCVLARLSRPDDLTVRPTYEVLKEVSETTIPIKELPVRPPTRSVGSDLESLNQLYNAAPKVRGLLFPNSTLTSCSFFYEPLGPEKMRISIFVPCVASVLAANPHLENEAYSHCFTIPSTRLPRRDGCEMVVLPRQNIERVVAISFDLNYRPNTAPNVDNIEVAPRVVQLYQTETSQFRQIATVLASALMSKPQFCPRDHAFAKAVSNEPLDDAALYDIFVTAANHCAAKFMLTHLPEHALLARQHFKPCTDGLSAARVEAAEYYTPHAFGTVSGRNVIVQADHAPSGGNLVPYTTACHPGREYAGVLVQRLLLIAFKLSKRGSASAVSVLSHPELELLSFLRHHVARLNAFTMAYNYILPLPI